MFYRLGDPKKQSGIPGVVIPIEFSETKDPFTVVLSSSIIVSGVIQNNVLTIDEDELDAMIDKIESDYIAMHNPAAQSNNIKHRIGEISRSKIGRLADGTKRNA